MQSKLDRSAFDESDDEKNLPQQVLPVVAPQMPQVNTHMIAMRQNSQPPSRVSSSSKSIQDYQDAKLRKFDEERAVAKKYFDTLDKLVCAIHTLDRHRHNSHLISATESDIRADIDGLRQVANAELEKILEFTSLFYNYDNDEWKSVKPYPK